jgi:hypothetical protein
VFGVITVAAVLVCGSGSAGAATGEAANVPALATCAYGTDVPGLTGFMSSGVASAAGSYAGGLSGDAPETQGDAGQVFAAAAAAYVYGLPVLSERAAVADLVSNEMVSFAALATPQAQGVVAPDVAFAPTVASFDLAGGPIVINVPSTNGRFYTFQFLDAFTNAFGYVGSGSTGTQAGAYALVPPGWTGSLPSGVTAIHSPTDMVWLIGRTLVHSSADLAAVRNLQLQYRATPLGEWSLGIRRAPVVLNRYPSSTPLSIPTGAAFITKLNADLSGDPPPAADACALQAMSAAGVQQAQASSSLAAVEDDPVMDAALNAGTAFGAKIVASAQGVLNAFDRAGNNGWAIFGPWVGSYGTRYLARAIVATVGLGANTPQQSIYPIAETDGDGHQLNGSQRYTIRFPKGDQPPAGAFWSVTMYTPSLFLYSNPLDRYAIGSYTNGLHFGSDGSLTIYIQHQEPAASDQQPNWLPAPTGPFQLMLRLYEPSATALDGGWKPPPVEPPVVAVAPPALSRIRISPNSFRPARHGGTLSAHGPGLLTYRDTRPAVTSLTLLALRAHGRQVTVVRFTHHDRAGTNRLRLTGRAHGHPLAKGRYLIRAVAHAGSVKSKTISVRFRIV